MVIKAHKVRFRISLRHQNRGSSQAAADVGDACSRFEFRFHVAERRNPFVDQVRAIVGAEEPLGAGEKARDRARASRRLCPCEKLR